MELFLIEDDIFVTLFHRDGLLRTTRLDGQVRNTRITRAVGGSCREGNGIGSSLTVLG